MRQACAQLFGIGQHRKATEILVEHTMLVSRGADREKMLAGREFDEHGKLANWDLTCMCHKISRLPESFGALVCRGDLILSRNQLRALPDGFGNITVGGNLYLNDNQLQALPEGFGDIIVGGDLNLYNNQLQSLPEGFGDITVGEDLNLYNNHMRYPSNFPNVKKVY